MPYTRVYKASDFVVSDLVEYCIDGTMYVGEVAYVERHNVYAGWLQCIENDIFAYSQDIVKVPLTSVTRTAITVDGCLIDEAWLYMGYKFYDFNFLKKIVL